MSNQIDRLLSFEPLNLNLTENELIDSDANQLDLTELCVQEFKESYRDTISNDVKGIYSSKKEETSEEELQSFKQKAYVDFDLFYSELKNARISSLIDSTTFKKFSEKAKDY